jgi:hypothetical protein
MLLLRVASVDEPAALEQAGPLDHVVAGTMPRTSTALLWAWYVAGRSERRPGVRSPTRAKEHSERGEAARGGRD